MSILVYCILFAFVQTGSHASEFRVGGKNGWVVPNNTNTLNYSDWAGRNRFQVGDSLVFVYNPSEDSVLQVSEGDYKSCSTSDPIASFKDGKTVFKLSQTGPVYFISGASGHCQKSQKLHVIVLSIRGGTPSSSSSPRSAVAPALQLAGFMCGFLLSLCGFIL
uniref:Phytocyanin domain-containing protein n=1 Tax=Picea sitchensis TaxID=3332 RepID=A9NQX3_PICSI|nr:unknown [Picea sitchensis]